MSLAVVKPPSARCRFGHWPMLFWACSNIGDIRPRSEPTATGSTATTIYSTRHDAAKIRAFFIHPDWARRGVGTLLLDACENAAKSAGFSRFEMGATLTGAKLFRARGYLPVRNLEVPLVNGESLPIIQMEKAPT